MLIDSHCHLNELAPDELARVLERARANGVVSLIAVGAGYGFASNPRTLAIAREYPQVFCALGMHPHDAKAVTPEILTQLESLARDGRVRAIGEIGLDYHYAHSDPETQRQVLRLFVRLARTLNKPVMIHDRECGGDCVDILNEEGAQNVGGMVHCFTGTRELARRYLDLGFYVSFSGIVTFKKADDLRAIVKTVPPERLLVETDSPFLAPVPHRGKTNEPAFVKHVAECVAQVREVPFEHLARLTTENARRFFNLPI